MGVLDQIAKTVGCSTATVSRTLNASGPVSRKVREEVFRTARNLGYRAPGNGSARKTTETLTAEILLCRVSPVEQLTVVDGRLDVGPPHLVEQREFLSSGYRLSRSFEAHILDGIVGELRAHGWRASVQVVHDLTGECTLRLVGASDVRSVLVLGEYAPDLDRFVDCCPRPLMLVDQVLPRTDVSSVGIDNLGGIAAGFEHLLALGHRAIGFVAHPTTPPFAERREAFLCKAASAGLSLPAEWLCDSPSQIQITGAATSVAQLLRREPRPTALMCANDFLALGVLRAAAEVGLRVPADLSVVGFDGTEVATAVTPPLTTVRVPTVEMGRTAVRLLLTEVQYGRPETPSGFDVRLKTKLVVGGTTARR